MKLHIIRMLTRCGGSWTES